MVMNIDLKELERKAFRDSMQDGLMEIMIGIILLGMAAASVSLVFVVGYILPLLFMGPITEAVRKRYTYPRLGYVKLHTDSARKTLPGIFLYQFIVFAVMAVALFIIFGDVTNPQLWFKWSPLWFAMMLVGAFLYSAGKSGSRSPYVYAFVSVISAFVFCIVDFKDLKFPYLFGELGTGLVVYFIFMGGVLAIIGLILFVHFLRKYPLPPEGA